MAPVHPRPRVPDTSSAAAMPARRAVAPPAAVAPEASASPTVVHVTIGRIEVRAATADGAAARRSQPTDKPAVTTLDAYLRRRAASDS
jgi:hypothetical protein